MAGDISSVYKEKIWGKTESGENITDGYVFRGKRTFQRAREGLEQMMTKGFKNEKNGVNYRVLDNRIKGVENEIEIEVIHNNDKGETMLKLYGPNKKKENVVSVTRSKGSDYKFITIFAENVIKPLMNEFLQGKVLKSIKESNEKDREDLSKAFKCQFCDKTSPSKSGLKCHVTKMHPNAIKEVDQRESEDEVLIVEDDSIICSTDNDLTLEEIVQENGKNKVYKKKCESCPYEVEAKRKYKVVQEMLEHKSKNHTNKSTGTCSKCKVFIKDSRNMKRHMRDVHGNTTYSTSPPPKKKKNSETIEIKDNDIEFEDMEIDTSEEEISTQRSRMQDEKVLDKEKRNEEKERLYRKSVEEKEIKKKEEAKTRAAKEKLEKKKSKQKSRNLKRKKSVNNISQNIDKIDNLKEVPENCKKFVNENDVVYVVPGDGRCAQNSAAALLFHDEKFGPGLKRKINLFFAENFFKKYQFLSQCSIDSPYRRQLKGTVVEFTDPEELIKFLRNDPDAIHTWSDSEDLVVLSDMYQIKIKIITTKGQNDPNPIVNWIHPDPNLKNLAELNIDMKDMVLIHEDDLHFNLIIPGDSDLAKLGSLSRREKSSKENNTVEEVDMEVLKDEYEKSLKKQSFIEKEYFECQKELRKKSEEVEKLRIELEDIKIILKLKEELEKQTENDDSPMEIEDDQVNNSELLYSWKTAGFKRRNPQCESIRNTKTNSYKVKDFKESIHESKKGLGKHMQSKHIEKDKSISSTKCDNKASRESEFTQHLSQNTDDDREFNCIDCPFQGTREEELKNHISMKHTIKCRICDEAFNDKRNLMKHRKKEHPSRVAPCKNFLEGICSYTAESCHWIHGKVEKDVRSINCYICGKAFNSKTEVMKHRRESHGNVVEPCNKFVRGECPFQDNFCWFKHENESKGEPEKDNDKKDVQDDEDLPVFQKVQKPSKPPIY